MTTPLIPRIEAALVMLRSEFPEDELNDAIERLNHSVDFGCFFDPTRWMQRNEVWTDALDTVEKLKTLLYTKDDKE